jgi:dTDP-4-amino-4,6-dideoxygalactose transaminase
LDLSRRTQKHKPAIEGAIARVLERSNFILGDEVRNFEKLFAEYIGVQYCLGVANGTDAIELGLRALGVGPVDRVATVANAGNYATTAILAAGATPFYLDVDVNSRNVTIAEIQRAIAANIKAIVVTHLYGLAVSEINEISRLCKEASVGLLEDCAQAPGAEVDGRRVGSFGDVASFSFYPTKNLGALGDGGAIVTPNEAIFSAVKKLRAYGWGEKYSVTLQGGRNSRLDEMQAAILTALLPYLDEENEARMRIANFLNANIKVSDVALPVFRSGEYVSHLYVVAVEDRSSFISKLGALGIGTAIHYPVADHQQPINQSTNQNVSLPVTESLTRQVVSLPCFPEMTQEEIRRVADAVNW